METGMVVLAAGWRKQGISPIGEFWQVRRCANELPLRTPLGNRLIVGGGRYLPALP
jgi:hypothetical protein